MWAVPSVIARGTIRSVDASRALALPGVLAVITPDNAPRLPGTGDPELALFQTRAVAYRGQFVAAVVAGTLEVAREAAGRVVIEYDQAPHDVILTADHPGLYKPDFVDPRYETDTAAGDFDGAFAAAPVRVDATYRTPGRAQPPDGAARHRGQLARRDVDGIRRHPGPVPYGRAGRRGVRARTRAGPGDRRARGRRLRR